MRIAVAALLFAVVLTACEEPEPPAKPTPPPVYTLRHVVTTNPSGVGASTCPDSAELVGGGCHCEGGGLFTSVPAGNGYVCGCCCDATKKAVEARAICMTSSNPRTLTRSESAALTIELDATLDRLRQRRSELAAGQ